MISDDELYPTPDEYDDYTMKESPTYTPPKVWQWNQDEENRDHPLPPENPSSMSVRSHLLVQIVMPPCSLVPRRKVDSQTDPNSHHNSP